MDHFQSQASFATYAARGVDMLIPLDGDPERALTALASRAGVERRCVLRSENVGRASSSAFWLPSASSLRAALTPDLIRRLCDVYSQDFLCFNLPLPPECTEEPSRRASVGAGSDGKETDAPHRRTSSSCGASYDETTRFFV